MRTAISVLRILFGLLFLVFGLNGFLHFLKMPPIPAPAGAFFGALGATGYMIPLLFATQILGGILLVIGLLVPVGLAILAPVVVNIILFHIFLDPAGLPLAIVVIVVEAILTGWYWQSFASMFRTGMQ